MPVPGNTFDAVIGAIAGAQNDGVGPAFSGSTSLENRYLVDGIDVTGLTFGNVGSPVINQFIENIEVITGGYNAEYGRSTGGIANVVTRTGTNTLRGSIFATYQPGFLTAEARTTPVNASSIDVVGNRAYTADLGFEMGGPIIKDRAWFYVGFAPHAERTDFTRTTKRETDCRTVLANGTMSSCDPRPVAQGGHADGTPDIDPRTGFFITDPLDTDVRSGNQRTYNAIGKINVAITPENQAQIELLALPSTSETPGLLGLPNTGITSKSWTTDAMAKWSSKFDDSKVEVEATIAWHRSTLESHALDPSLDNTPRQLLEFGDLGTWSALGGERAATVAGCRDGGGSDPYQLIVNCPMQSESYAIGGPGALSHDIEDRRTARLAAVRRQKAAGNHEIKVGIDVDDDTKQLARLFSGGAFLENEIGANTVKVTRWVQLEAPGGMDPRFDQQCHTPDVNSTSAHGSSSETFQCAYVGGQFGDPGTVVGGETFNWAAYARDSWQIRNNVTLNLGARYEEQLLRYAQQLQNTTDPLTGEHIGKTAMALEGNLAPRLGVIWDPTNQGRSKLYASWGRFFESIPMDINDRSFGGEVSYAQQFTTNGPQPCGPTNKAIGGPDGVGCLTPSGSPSVEQLVGSSGVLVAPGIGAEYLDEAMLGAEFEVGGEIKLGVMYQNRRLGRVIEDVSPDGAQTYIIANPGEWSAADEAAMNARINATTDMTEKARLQHELQLFRGIRVFDKPTRNYDAVELTASRQFSKGLYLNASYTYSRTQGNYPGSVSYDNGQIDPNISSQYDLIELLSNRAGPLPQDRPHSVKLDAYWVHPMLDGVITLGTRARAISGVPENALGAHYLYGPNESFLLPRGILGRTEIDHGVDLHVAYRHALPHHMSAEVFADIFNVYNRQGTFSVDDTYAPAVRAAGGVGGGSVNNVNPISGGEYADLIWAKVIDANGNETNVPTARNPNFHQPTARYAPASAQIGARISF